MLYHGRRSRHVEIMFTDGLMRLSTLIMHVSQPCMQNVRRQCSSIHIKYRDSLTTIEESLRHCTLEKIMAINKKAV